MNEIQVFNFNHNKVRTVMVDDEPWFVGKDVATVLGYTDTYGALKKHVDDEDKQNCQNDSFKTSRGMTVINESGLYSLIFGSKLPEAKKFKRWVTHEVLPALRKTGEYKMPTSNIEVMELMFHALKDTNADVSNLNERLGEIESTRSMSWRDRMMKEAYAYCDSNGLCISPFLRLIYKEMENRSGRSLSKTLSQRKKRMKLQGVASTKINQFRKIDVIEQDKPLRELFEEVFYERVN